MPAPISSVRGRIVLGFGVLVLTLVLVAASAVTLIRQHRTDVQTMEAHSESVALLDGVALDATSAIYLLQSYVDTGDESLPPVINSNLISAGAGLIQAIENEEQLGNHERAASLRSILESASDIPTTIQNVIETRRAGDMETASLQMASLNDLQEVSAVFEEASDGAQQDLASVRERSDRTAALAVWLIIGAGGLASLIALAASVLIAKSIINPLSRLESTALAVARGDLDARSSISGPRELSHLGRTMNLMLETIDDRTNQLEVANMELTERNRQLTDARARASLDALTNVGNHRAFHERIKVEFARAEEKDDKVSLVMLDIDDFKRVNDSRGHQAGDHVIRSVAEALTSEAGQRDTYRYGGDEFAVLLPGVDNSPAADIAERLRLAIGDLEDGYGKSVTVSLGVASFPGSAGSAEELIYGADAAMYWAKSVGKNRVGNWGELVRTNEQDSQPWYVSDNAVKAPDAVSALVAALKAKDPGTSAHTDRCSWYSGKLAQALALSREEISIVRLSSLLHDIGKIAVPDEVLFKPGPLNEDEWAQMKKHPTAALHVLREIRAIHDATPAILHHHEHFNGSGYPDGVAGEDIPIASRILLVTDAFDAMTTDRPYRKALPLETAIAELKRNAGAQFDPRVVKAFLKIVDEDGLYERHHSPTKSENEAEAVEATSSRGR